MKTSTLAALSAICLGALSSADALAQDKKYGPGVTDTEIKLGQTIAYSGPASAFGSYGRVMAAYFQMINDKGGIKGRKINLLSLDNAFSPPKALEQTRKLVEDDNVLADVGTLGTVPNVSIHRYLNQAKVPHVFLSAGGKRFNDPKNFPYTVPFYPAFEMEGATFGRYILNNLPNAKIAVLYQNDDYGKDFLNGLKSALGDKIKITAEATYELADPTVDSQVIQLKSAGADTLLHFSTPKFAAQALRKAHELNWTPTQFLASPVNSVPAVLTPAGLDKVQGVLTTQFTKQAGDPAWEKDQEVIDYVAFMAKYAPKDSAADFLGLSGYVMAQAVVVALERCGDNLTRENLLEQATSFKNVRVAMHLPGVAFNNSKDNYMPYESLRMAKFEGSSWKLLDEKLTPAAAKK